MWLAWPPIPFTAILLLVALVPMFIAFDNVLCDDSVKKGKRVFRIAFLCFVIWNTASIYWVFNSLNAVMPLGIAMVISLIPFGLGSLLMAIAFWLYYHMRLVSGRWWSYIGLICFWIAYEYLHQRWDLSFPWMNLGNGLAEAHYLAQWYEFTGVYGGTFWILMSNIMVFETWRAHQQKNVKARNQLAIRSIAHIIIPIIVSLAIYFNYEEKINPANIVVVQPNIDPYDKFGTGTTTQQIDRMIQLSDSVGQVNTEFFIWPETAISEDSDEQAIRQNSHYLNIRSFLGKYKNGNLIAGIESFSVYDSAKTSSARKFPDSPLYFDVFNAALMIENSERVQFYHKSKLVPGVEQIPFASLTFLKPAFAAFGGSAGSYGKQDEPSVFYSQSGIGAAPVICYESIWGEYVTEYTTKGAQFIAIITNDGWWGNTSGKDQHLLYAKLRAIETRRWVARSANTGISAFIDQKGDVVQRSKWWTSAALKQDINLNEELTFYTKVGDLIAKIGSLAAGGFMLFLLIATIRPKKRSVPNGTDLLN